MCKNGFPVSSELSSVIQYEEDNVRKDETLSQMYINPINNEPYKTGEIIKLPNFASTLETIAEYGAKAFYDGELSQVIVNEINEKGD